MLLCHSYVALVWIYLMESWYGEIMLTYNLSYRHIYTDKLWHKVYAAKYEHVMTLPSWLTLCNMENMVNLIPCSSYLKAPLTWYNSYQEQWLQIPLQSYSVEKFANYLYRENRKHDVGWIWNILMLERRQKVSGWFFSSFHRIWFYMVNYALVICFGFCFMRWL